MHWPIAGLTMSRSLLHGRVDLILIAGLSAIALLATRYRLARRAFWFDEVSTANVNASDTAAFINRLIYEPYNGLYYVLLRGWSVLGHSDATLRGLSVAFAVATIPVFYLLAQQVFDRKTALIATTLLCANAFFVHHAQEARQYAMCLFFVVASTLVLLKALDEPRARWLAAYALLASGAILGHFFAAMVLAGHLLYVLARRSLSVRWAAALAVPAATGLLLAAVLLSTGAHSWIRATSVDGVITTFRYVVGGFSNDLGNALLIFYVIAAVVGVLAVARTATSVADPKWLVAAWLIIPVLAGLALSLWKPNLVARYYIIVLPPLLMLVGFALSRIPFRPVVAACLVVLLSLSLTMLARWYTAPYQDWRGAARYFHDQRDATDAVIFVPTRWRNTFQYYYPGAVPEVPLPASAAEAGYLAATMTDQDRGVWFVKSGRVDPVVADRKHELEDALAASLMQRVHRKFGLVEMHIWLPSNRP